MKMRPLHIFVFLVFASFCQLQAQVNDCSGAGVICDDGLVTSNSQGPGINDFASATNDNGCLQAGEHQSSWYYFEFMPNMPVNSTIEFTIAPNGGSGEDFDFAIYGPFVNCDSLGSPIRCSYASPNCAFCPSTGLGNGTFDTSEGAAGDGFLAPLTVQPGQGYFLLVDNWLDSSNGFNLSWGGPAASYLNCNANPDCTIEVNAGSDIQTCVNPDPIQLNGAADNTEGQVVYTWVAENPEHLAFLSQTNIANPVVNVPSGFIDTITYTLTVADNLCISFDQMTIIVANQFAPDIQEPELFCENWSYELDAGEGFETYQWSTGSTNQSITVSDPGTYTVTVTNVGGCASVDEVVLENPSQAPAQPNIVGDTLLCIDSSIPLWAGAGYASYQWEHGPINPGVLIVEPGTYTVTVTNAIGCLASDSIVITGVDAVATPVDLGNTAELCLNATMELDPGSEFITYDWSNFSTAQTITVDTSGLYCVTVTDINGCKSSDCVVVNQVDNEDLYITGYPYFCESGTELSVSTDSDSYMWSTGSTQQTVFIDNPGLYSVTVVDDGCQDTLQVYVQNNRAIPPEIDGALSLCSGEPTLLTAQEGYASYQWSDGTTGPSLSVAQSGNYSISVIDQEGCEAVVDLDITETAPPIPDVLGNLTFCQGDTTWLTGAEGYTFYQWDGLPEDSTEIMITSTGNYTLTVIDSNGCEGSNTFEVIERPTLIPEIMGNDFFCLGEFVTLSVNEAYVNYQWSDESEENELMVAAPGSYSVTVEDAEGCIGENTIEITELPLPEVSISGPDYVCDGGSIILEAPAGFMGYSWSTGDSTQTISVSEPGIYVVEVTNSNGCSDKAVAGVQLLESLSPEITGEPAICGGSTATLGLSESYSNYLWSDGSSGNTLTVNQAGWVSVTVTDENGCTGETSIEVVAGGNFQMSIQGETGFCENGSTLLSTDEGYESYSWSTGANSFEVTINTPGMYSVTVTDAEGCFGIDTVEVIEYPTPTLDIMPVIDFCSGDMAILDAGMGFASYQWSNNANTQMIEVATPGEYSVTVSNEEGCSHSASISVVENEAPEFQFEVPELLSCGAASVTLTPILSQEPENYTFQWLDAQGNLLANENESTLEVSSTGIYQLILTDIQSGCESMEMVSVLADEDLPTANAGTDQQLDCNQPFAFLDGTGSSEGNEYLYEWTTSEGNILSDATSPMIQVDAPGTYWLTITDTLNNCSHTDAVVVTEDFEFPEASAGADQFLHCNQQELILNATFPMDGTLVSMQWMDLAAGTILSNNQNLEVSSPGTYIFELTNLENGCSTLDEVVVEEIAPPSDFDLNIQSPTCSDTEDGNISINGIIGGLPPFEYRFGGNDYGATVSFFNLTADEYIIGVRDANGCEYETLIELKTGNDLQLEAGDDQYIEFGETVNLEAVVNIPREEIISVQWKGSGLVACDTCWVVNVSPAQSTTYLVTVIDENGCEVEDRVNVFVQKPRHFYIPNAFTPDNDGHNDGFTVYAGDDISIIRSIKIFNRWGGQVFEATDIPPNDEDQGWRGDKNNIPSTSGVYLYMIEIEFADGVTQIEKGDITLLR